MLTKILIADSSGEFRMALTEQLKDRYSVRSCSNGTQALSLLDSFCPDLLIVDLMLQSVDGLGVLLEARKKEHCPPALVTATVFPPYAVSLIEQLNVAYAMLKPCDMDILTERIDDLVTNICAPLPLSASPYSAVTAVLLELGMNPGRGGFQYCRDAILMLEREPHLRVTKDIYPVISKRYNTGATAVEKNIRDAVSAAWKSADRSILLKYFIPAANGQIPRPSNHVFLSTLTEQIFSVQRKAR